MRTAFDFLVFDLSVFDVAAVAVLAAVTVCGLLLYGRLPARMTIHFGPTGRPDGYAPRLVGVLAVPAIGGAVIVAPRLFRTGGDAVASSLVLAVAVFLAYVQAVVLAWNVGYRVNVVYAVLPALAAFLVVVFAITGLS